MGLDSALQVLFLQMMKRKMPSGTKVSKHIQTEDNYVILELNATSNAIPAFRTEYFVVYKSRAVNRTVRF